MKQSKENYRMKKLLSLTAAAVSLIANTAMAQGYLVGGAGVSNISLNCNTGAACDKSDVGLKLIGGYQFTNGFAIEVGAMSFGTGTAKGAVNGIPVTAELKGTSVGVGVAYFADFSPTWQGVARLGVGTNKTELTGSAGGQFGSESKSSSEPYYGFGVAYRLNPVFSVGLDMDFTKFKFDGGGADTRMATVVGRMKF